MSLTEQTLEHPITEDDIVNFLINTPDFFERHAALLATVQLSSGHGTRAISLQERQAQMLREKIKGLELKIAQMMRHGQDNVAIIDKIQRWMLALLQTSDACALPRVIASEIKSQFLIPQAVLKLWNVAPQFAHEDFAQGVSEDEQTFAASLALPYCGVNSGFEVASWLSEPGHATSLALIPLRPTDTTELGSAFGLLILASPDPERFTGDMGTDFLYRMGELASAALMRLRD